MMVLEKLVQTAAAERLNIYTIAAMDHTGLQQERIQPADSCTNSYSVAKTFTMTAVGMLWDRRQIRVDDKVYDILQEEFPNHFDLKWKQVTVEHLLKHTAGFGRGFLDIDVEEISEYPSNDFLKIVLSEPLPYLPGAHYQYTDAAFYLLSRIVTKLSGQRLDDFLRPMLFDQLGFQEMAWSCCPHGYPMGATGLYIRTSDMVKLGWLYAQEGCYNGKRILSAEWVGEVLQHGYEFCRYHDNGLYAKGGMNGQMLCFSVRNREAYAWHAYEPHKDVNILLDQI